MEIRHSAWSRRSGRRPALTPGSLGRARALGTLSIWTVHLRGLGTNLGLLSSKKALQGETRNVTKLRPCCVLSTEAGSRGSGLVNRSAGKDGRGGRRSFSKYVQIPHAIY